MAEYYCDYIFNAQEVTLKDFNSMVKSERKYTLYNVDEDTDGYVFSTRNGITWMPKGLFEKLFKRK